MSVETLEYTAKDFSSDQEVKWCPGCGDYAILKAVQKAMPLIGRKKEDIVFVSGIGCSSRFPYYMDTYGFHSIHGRAPAIATGVKLANPDLSVWQITGDGDALAIGGNHFIHLIRRNVSINVLLFNNRIYGLTKGQFSPTTNLGQHTKSSPQGTIDNPFNPGELVIGANGHFFARATDTNAKVLTEILVEAEKHQGACIIEIMQNCVIFNKDIFADYTAKDVKLDHQVHVEQGKPMIFGSESNKGLVLNGFKLEIVTIGENGVTEEDILVHDAYEEDSTLHMMLAKLQMPVVTGIIRSYDDESFEIRMKHQVEEIEKNSPYKSVNDLLESGETWEIK
jgi:2-oxoglutarate/2-oxoacid ferredoxin oxidoreductase subunit beta